MGSLVPLATRCASPEQEGALQMHAQDEHLDSEEPQAGTAKYQKRPRKFQFGSEAVAV